MPAAALPAFPLLSPASVPQSIWGLNPPAHHVQASYVVSRRSHSLLFSVIGGHAALLWALSQLAPVQAALKELAPVTVRIVSLAPPAPAPAPPLLKPAAPRAAAPAAPAALPVPVVEQPLPQVAEAPPAPAPVAPLPAAVAPGATQASAAPATERLSVAPPAPTPPAPPAAPPAPKLLPASAVSYRQPPAIEVPLASRRLNESGTVVLRVWVGKDGAPRQITVQRSSGFTRLDDQAVAAMRQARFTPYSENGEALECIVIAPLAYELN